jgi:5-methylphenazine-1-carboxylate 1-monooxygenase
MNATPIPPRLEPVFSARIGVAAPRSLGRVAGGERRIVDITGGEVSGPKLTGRILPGGADWQVVRDDGTAVLEARYTIEAADGALVYVRNYGYRHGPRDVLTRIAQGEEVDPGLYYFRTAPAFETAAPQYDWLNRTVAVGSAMRTVDRVIIDFYAVR